MFGLNHRGNKKGKIIESECILCGNKYTTSKNNKGNYVTCSEYCTSVIITLRKSTGVYVQCSYCDHVIYLKPHRKNKSGIYFCNSKCDTQYRRKVRPLGARRREKMGKKYYGPNWLKQSRVVRKNAGYKCVKCGVTEDEYGKKMSVHHIRPFVYFDSYQEANELRNLMCVCEDCHRKIHSGENHPSKFKEELFGENYKSTVNVKNKQYKIASKIVDRLKNTDETLSHIAKDLGVSLTTVRRIYKGERWNNLYEEPLYLKYPRSKDEGTVLKIIEKLTTTNLTLTDISKEYNVGLSLVQKIYKGKTWKHLYDTPIYKLNPRKKSEYIGKPRLKDKH